MNVEELERVNSLLNRKYLLTILIWYLNIFLIADKILLINKIDTDNKSQRHILN